jgi:FkbM family methyltransferase
MNYLKRMGHACQWRLNTLTDNKQVSFPEWPEDGYRSQIGQDKWVTEVVFPGKREGFFVDIGAYDGITISNTYVLEKRLGWRGICIEAGLVFQELQRNRACACENVCLAGEPGPVRFSLRNWESGITSFLDKPGRQGPAEREMQAETLVSVLKRNHAPSVIDYCSLDTEGSEYEILRTFPFEDYVFRSMTIEHNNATEVQSSLRRLLSSQGYNLFMQVGIEDWWLHESMLSSVTVDPLAMAESYFLLWHKAWGMRQQMLSHNCDFFCFSRSLGPRLPSVFRAVACGLRSCFRV